MSWREMKLFHQVIRWSEPVKQQFDHLYTLLASEGWWKVSIFNMQFDYIKYLTRIDLANFMWTFTHTRPEASGTELTSLNVVKRVKIT